MTVDQIVSGFSTLMISVMAAHALGVANFGLFGIVFLVYVFALGICRALACEPLLVHPVQAEERSGDAIGSAVVLGAWVAGVLALVGALASRWNGSLGSALLLLACGLPLLVLQDVGRYLGFSTRRPGQALTLDMIWVVLQVGTVLAVSAAGLSSLPWFVLAWVSAGAVSSLPVLWYHRRSTIRLDVSWLRETWGFSWRYLLSYTATQGASLAGGAAVGLISGARAVGALRGALLMVRPFSTVQAACVAAGVAEVSRADNDLKVIAQHVRRTTAVTCGVAVGNMVVVLLLPDSAGRAILSDTWAVTVPLLLPVTLQTVFGGLIGGTRAALIGTRQIQRTVAIDVAGTVLIVVLTIAGAFANGPLGAVWGIAAAQAGIALIWWVAYFLHRADGQPAPQTAYIERSPEESALTELA